MKAFSSILKTIMGESEGVMENDYGLVLKKSNGSEVVTIKDRMMT